ncbi:hypothetical protein MSAN_01690700 [Mycena sanguinolenta]|uniref:Uncharacterized protein n=1 Tax=Mycena sanguinolenta TaxID=230812 RepID=A0A8H6XXY8_9AGAR|nr:hypothetical protein MSAN_01690700 [Mycena sanguinolenta]
MQIGLAAVAFALSLIAAVAAQTSTASAPFIVATTVPEAYTPQRKTQPKIVAAIVVSTVGGTLIIIATVLFFVRRRMRRRAGNWKILNTAARGDVEISRRVVQLEGEVRAMREQLDRLKAHRLAALPGYGTETALYTHEKDLAMFKQGVDVKDEKVHPPTYAD